MSANDAIRVQANFSWWLRFYLLCMFIARTRRNRGSCMFSRPVRFENVLTSFISYSFRFWVYNWKTFRNISTDKMTLRSRFIRCVPLIIISTEFRVFRRIYSSNAASYYRRINEKKLMNPIFQCPKRLISRLQLRKSYTLLFVSFDIQLSVDDVNNIH